MAVDAAARAVESQVDNAFRELSLMERDIANATFHVLLAAELHLDDHSEMNIQERAIDLDMLVNLLKYAIAWAREATGSKVASKSEFETLLIEARHLITAASNYMFFAVAYTYGSRDVIDLTLQGQHFRTARVPSAEARYEAYNMLLKPTLEKRVSADFIDEDRILPEVQRAAKRGVIPPSIPLIRRVLVQAFELLERASEPFYHLPLDWRFDGFTLREFRQVHNVIRGIVYVWRQIAPVMDQTGVPHATRFPYLVHRNELKSAVKDITALPSKTVERILEHLKYGALGINKPDPAIQPLIPFGNNSFILSSPLILGNAAERNLAVLLNALPTQRKIYADLTQHKESLMRQRIVSGVPDHILNWHGRLRSDLPTVDLVLADAAAGAVLLIELKWFIDPAEPREIDERSDELRKGIKQCKKLMTAVTDDPTLISVIVPFKIVEVASAVVSANWIGLGNIQDETIPIINEEHLIAKIRAANGLVGVLHWLSSRDYLPREGVHYKIEFFQLKHAGYMLDWYGLQAVEAEVYLPL
jgi:hypothetical protein